VPFMQPAIIAYFSAEMHSSCLSPADLGPSTVRGTSVVGCGERHFGVPRAMCPSRRAGGLPELPPASGRPVAGSTPFRRHQVRGL